MPSGVGFAALAAAFERDCTTLQPGVEVGPLGAVTPEQGRGAEVLRFVFLMVVPALVALARSGPGPATVNTAPVRGRPIELGDPVGAICSPGVAPPARSGSSRTRGSRG